MSQDNINFKKDIYSDLNSLSNLQNRKNAIKLKIMDKFDVSSIEADNILSQIIKKEKVVYSSKESNNDAQNILKQKIVQNNNDLNNSLVVKENSCEFEYNNSNNNDDYSRLYSNFDYLDDDTNLANENKFDESSISKINTKNPSPVNNIKSDVIQNDNNVDIILGDIIPNYNQQVSIDVNHVDLTFEVQNEKVDTLKETFIRFFKRDSSKKIRIHALNDISFKIFKGEKVGIIGYNGAGKSTLLNVITGIYQPDKGNVMTYGNISPLLSLGAGFDYNFSGRRNIILNGAVLGYDRDFLESKIDEIIEFSELGEFIDMPIKNYSSGMLAKLGFSIATAVNPDILIIDEILGVGDVNFQKKSGDKIRSLMDGGTTVLLVSHSIPQIRELCDKALWIDNGSLRAFDEVNKVCDAYLKDAEKASNEQLANIQFG